MAKLTLSNEQLICSNSHCKNSFPIIDGIPILINEDSSIFYINDFISRENTTFSHKSTSRIKKFIKNLFPDINSNIKTNKNYEKFAELVLKQDEISKVLVVGGSVLGQGMEALLSVPSIELIGSDVTFGPCTSLICDGHDLPFEDNSFDGVIIQAVLEHVVDPNRCVEEIHRVLKDNGIVYAETPFIQQVHMGKYDFTRFTHLGHRRLFRKFDEISSGSACGPGMALAWSYQYFLGSFVTTKAAQSFTNAFAKLTSFWLKYFDYYLIDKPGVFDAASSYYFFGRKSNQILSDRELIKLYKGLK